MLSSALRSLFGWLLFLFLESHLVLHHHLLHGCNLLRINFLIVLLLLMHLLLVSKLSSSGFYVHNRFLSFIWFFIIFIIIFLLVLLLNLSLLHWLLYVLLLLLMSLRDFLLMRFLFRRTWSFIFILVIFSIPFFLSKWELLVWKVDLTLNLHSIIFIHHHVIFIVSLTFSFLLEQVFKFSFKQFSLLFREFFRIVLILLVKFLDDLILLLLG